MVLVASSCAGDKPHPLEEVEGCRYLAGPDVWDCDPFTSLRGLDLTGANLYGANLSNADLTDADLTGANVAEVDITNTTFRRTTWYDGKVYNS